MAEASRSYDVALELWDAVDPSERPAGIDLPGNVVSAQAAGGVQTNDPQVGDLVVFYSGHIGIYAGGGMMWDNPGYESSVVGWQNVYRSIDVIGSGYYFVTYR